MSNSLWLAKCDDALERLSSNKALSCKQPFIIWDASCYCSYAPPWSPCLNFALWLRGGSPDLSSEPRWHNWSCTSDLLSDRRWRWQTSRVGYDAARKRRGISEYYQANPDLTWGMENHYYLQSDIKESDPKVRLDLAQLSCLYLCKLAECTSKKHDLILWRKEGKFA